VILEMNLNLVIRITWLPILFFTACRQVFVSQPETSTPSLPMTATLPSSPQSTSVPPAAESSPSLKAGQWTYIFYHDGLEQVVLVIRVH
jgi:hypothetical protein